VISATTYQNLPPTLPLSGGTITGPTTFQNGITANTISATTYQNLPVDPNTYVTGFTYGNNVFTLKQNNGQPDLTATINSVTGWTVNGNLTVTGNTSVQGLTATTVSATTYQNLPYSGTVKGSGTSNYLPRWTGTTSLGNSQIQDNGSTLFMGGGAGSLNSSYKVWIEDSNTGTTTSLFIRGNSSTFGKTVIQAISQGGQYGTGIYGVASGSLESVGVNGSVTSGVIGIGVKGIASNDEFTTITTGIGGYFAADNSNGYGAPTNAYSVQLIDGTQGLNKVLVSKTSDGKANWSDVLSGLTSVRATTMSATTFSANTVVVSGITINPKQTIALFFGHDSLSPGDTQTYYIGNAINLTAPISGSDGRRVIMPKTGQIVAVDICQNIGGVNGSSESSTFTINNVTQSTQSSITSSYVYTASSANIFYTLSSPLLVTAGDKIEIRWTTPAWVTNPTTVRQQMNVYLEY